MPISTYKLNDKQLYLLLLLYKFRFITIPLFANHKNLSTSSVHNSFNILMDRGLIKRHYNSSYRLQGKPARYYLALGGIKLLKGRKNLQEGVLRRRYKDGSLGEVFMDHSVEIYRLYLYLQQEEPETFQIFSCYETYGHDHFPLPLPDLYLERYKDLKGSPSEYFIRYYDPFVPVWVIKKDITKYMQHYEEEGWTSEIYPTCIFLVQNKRTRDNLERHIEDTINDLYIDEERMRVVCVEGVHSLSW